ncbi:hypothetical protein [Synechococcus sp. H55.10]|uniref:hypothetical protein n=1 Tax=Synechococcus sp. H55.10 TaxID=2964503 RepID=UPI0039C708F5
MAIVAEGQNGRIYLSPTAEQEAIARSAQPTWKPDADLPCNPRNFNTPIYGLDTYDKLFTPRQLVALTTFSDLVAEAREKAIQDAIAAGIPDDNVPLAEGGTGARAYGEAISVYLAFAVDKGANYWSTICAWHSSREIIMSTFARQAIPMVWDYAEANPFCNSSGNFLSGVDQAVKMITSCPATLDGKVNQHDATLTHSDDATPKIISTDPPYFDNIGYADLSDFFYVWLRRSLSSIYPNIFSTLLVPKAQELVATPYRFGGDKQKAREFFETGLSKAFNRLHDICHADYPLTVYYAFKQTEEDPSPPDSLSPQEQEGVEFPHPPTPSPIGRDVPHPPTPSPTGRGGENSEPSPSGRGQGEGGRASTGWETMLEGLIQSGLTIDGTWPMRTELTGNLKKNVSALASSIVLVCRPRPANAPKASRSQFLKELKRELPQALKLLQQGNIAPVDLAQASIGPGMAIYSRYAAVLENDGSPLTVRTALQLINQYLDEYLEEQEGELDSASRWAVTWFAQHRFEPGPYGDAEVLSKAKNVSLESLEELGILEARAGKVRLRERGSLSLPEAGIRLPESLPHWLITQFLIQTLDTQGEMAAAELLASLGEKGPIARDLAYRLYTLCDKKGWAQEALAYNTLVIAWPEISRLALQTKQNNITQPSLF